MRPAHPNAIAVARGCVVAALTIACAAPPAWGAADVDPAYRTALRREHDGDAREPPVPDPLGLADEDARDVGDRVHGIA